MLKRLRLWLLSRRADTIGELGRQLIDLQLDLAAAEKKKSQYDDLATRTLEDWRIDSQCRQGVIDNRSATIDAVLKAIDFPQPDEIPHWTPAAAQHAVAAHIDAKLQVVELRASKAERDAEDLRTALSEERNEHDKTRHKLEVSDEQNQHLWDVIQRDRARVAAEIAVQNRRKAQAETDAKRPPEEELP